MAQAAPACPYCGAVAEKVGGDVVYAHRRDLADKIFWRCPVCPSAWVGCHPASDQPLGRLADPELRRWKRAAHDAFDPLWRTGGSKNKRGRARSQAYAALAQALGIDGKDCHIGLFTVELCRRTIEAIPALKESLSQKKVAA